MWKPPAPIACTPLVNADATATGTELAVVELLPSWPNALSPQHTAAPADVTAHANASPTAIDCTPVVKLVTATGTALAVVELLPSWPGALSPQHIAPPFTMAQVFAV